MSRARVVGPLLAFALVGAACTGSESPTATERGTPSGPAVPQEARSLPGSLLVLDASGSLRTMLPDGTGRTTLAVGVPGSLQVLQAAWAPDGSRVAWAQVDVRDGAPMPRVVTSGPAGEGRVETLVDLVPFYLSWDPTSQHVAYLGNGSNDAVALGVVEEATTSSAHAQPLDEGTPYYFSWGPQGDRMLVHVGARRLDELTIAGGVSTVDLRPGVFQAPVWSPDGSTLVYARRVRGLQQRLVVVERGTPGARGLASGEGQLSFVLSPDGGRLAFQALGPDETDVFDPGLADRATDVGISVVDLATGRIDRVSKEVAHAWFWSPDGRHLAILEPVYQADGQVRFRWRVWDGTSSFATAPLTPAVALLQNYTPFFSQFAQSSTIWAPDGSAFAYPAEDPEKGLAVFIQPAREGAEPFPVAAGSFVVWSPA